MNGVTFDFRIIETFAQECGWESLDTLLLIRSITARVKAK